MFIVPHLLFREWGMWGTIVGFAATGETPIMIIIRTKNARCANPPMTGSKTVSAMDNKCSHDAVMEIIEKQKLIADHLKEVRDNFFWSNGLELLHSPTLEAVPGDAWAELPQYPNVEKWAHKLFAKSTGVLPHMSGHTGIAGAIASAVIAKTNDSQEIMDRATRLANLEWQLQHLTYWSSHTTHEAKKNRKTFDELYRQRELLRDSAVEALCLYKCGAHDFLNDFERYNSNAIGDIYCAEQYKAAFNKVMAWAVGYCGAFDKSESRAVNRSGETDKIHHLKQWIQEKLSSGKVYTADSLWNQISRKKDEQTDIPDFGSMYIKRDTDDKDKLYIVDGDGKVIGKEMVIKTFRTHFGAARKKM
ncbi:hypothetical protein [Cellvibrio fibrivorans]|uniref:Uncharacterized protein n=1 Tax=Cellvibrio fibrivorans TaxID=126350 RepID=A0ABU1V3R7_9GAMM|nr:hypothetical protein [Cellvibrio fibrivorans]MDR7092097.1 hypothetical protein [Cellvibrio fibrivorans]